MYMINAKKIQKCLFNDDSLTKTGDQSPNCSAHVTYVTQRGLSSSP